MAASVQVLCPNGRRQSVKITPNTKLLQILDEVCQRQGFIPPEDFKLVHGRKELDLSLSVRFSSLPNNAKLELARSTTSRVEQDVTIALQLESGQRLQDSFSPSITLWDLLQHFEDKQGIGTGNLTKVATEVRKSLHPVCIFMREEVIGEQALKATTLKKLALTSGKAIIRLLHRPVEENMIADICDQVEKDKVKQAKLEEIAQQKKGMREEEERHDMFKAAMSEQLSKVPEEMETTDSDTTSEAQQQQQNQQRRQEVNQALGTDVDMADDTLSSSSFSGGSSANKAPRKKPPAPSTSQPAARQSNSIEELRNLNIPGVEIYTPDDFSDLTPAEQAIARRLAQRFLPHLQAQASASPQASSSTATPYSNSIAEQSDNAFLNFKFPEEADYDNDGTSGSSSTDVPSSAPCERNALAYNSSEALPLSNQDVPDDFFEVTQSDVKLMYRDLQNSVHKMEDQPLMTKTMKQALAEAAYDHYERVVIRVHFPDRLVLQGYFRPRETVQALHTFVKDCLEETNLKFYLYTTPPKTILKDKKSSLAVSHLAPAALVYFGCNVERDHYMKKDLVNSLRSRLEAEKAVAEVLKQDARDFPKRSSSNSASHQPQPGPSGMSGRASTSHSSSSQSTLPSGAKVPKWLKLGKK